MAFAGSAHQQPGAENGKDLVSCQDVADLEEIDLEFNPILALTATLNAECAAREARWLII